MKQSSLKPVVPCMVGIKKGNVKYNVYILHKTINSTTQNYKCYCTKLWTVLDKTMLNYGQNYMHMQQTQTK